MAMLKLENIRYRYKNTDRDTLQGISCAFEGGTVSAVVGPSGSGKTTLLSVMAGLDRPTDGEAYIDGDKLFELDLDRYRRERTSMIFQAYQLFPLLTTLENVSYPLEMRGVSKADAEARAVELLRSVDIGPDKHRRYPSNLSGGEQQRVAIARALSSGAKVILADEPTGNLDVENGRRIMEILKRIAHDSGYCIVIVTHDLDIASACDRVYKMSDGMLTEGL